LAGANFIAGFKKIIGISASFFAEEKMKKLLIVVLSLSMMALFASCGGGGAAGADGPRFTLIYTHYQPGTPDQPKQAAALAFQAYVERATNGTIEVVIFPNSELGDGPSVLQAMQAGTIHMTVVHDGPVSALFPPIGVFNMPFLFENLLKHGLFSTARSRKESEKPCG